MTDPDRPSVRPFDKFQVNLAQIPDAERDIDLKIEALEERVERLVRQVEVTNSSNPNQKLPILGMILGISHDAKELNLLGKALQRVSGVVEELDGLKKRKALLSIAKEDPNWFVSTFGDFEADIDSNLDQFISDLEAGEHDPGQ